MKHFFIICVVLFTVLHVTDSTATTIGQNDDETYNLLKAEFGLYFRPAGLLQAASDKFYILIDVPLPRLNDFPEINTSLKCTVLPSNYSEAISICMEFENLFSTYRNDVVKYKSILNKQLRQMLSIIDSSDAENRHKRALPLIPIIGGLFSAGASIGNAYFTHKKLDALRQSIEHLRDRNYKLADKFMDLSERLIMITQTTDDNFEELERDISSSNERLSSLTKVLSSRIAAISIQTRIMSTRLINDIHILSKLTARGYTLITRGHMHFQTVIREMQRFIDGLLMLSTGRLPKELVSPDKLADIIQHSRALLYRTSANLEFTFTDLQYFYTTAETIFTITDNHILIELEVILKQKNQQFLSLFHIQSTYVPFNMTDMSSQARPHTKVVVDKDYFAVLGRNFVQIGSDQLQYCKSYGLLKVCEDKLLQVHRSQLNCISSIFWNYDIKTIENLCDFEYFPKMKPHPVILDAGNDILLSGFDTPWTLNCNKQSVPVRYDGYSYAILKRSTLCGCALVTSQQVYIPPHYNGCDNALDNFKPKFVVNAAVVSIFNDDIQDSLVNISHWYDDIPPYNVPEITIKQSDNSQVLYTDDNSFGPAKLKRLRTLIKENKEVFLTKEDKSESMIGFTHWFTNNKYVSFAISFLLSVLGGVALFIAVFACLRSIRMPVIAGALLSQQPTVAHASPIMGAVTRDGLDLTKILPAMFVHIAFSISIYLLFRLLKYVCKNYTYLKVLMPSQTTYKDTRSCDLYLELNSARKSTILYLCSVKANGTDIHISGMLRPEILKGHFGYFRSILTLDWNLTKFYLYISREHLPLPTVIYVPFFKRTTVQLIMRRPHIIRVLIGQNGIFTEIGRKSHNFVVKEPKAIDTTPDDPLTIYEPMN